MPPIPKSPPPAVRMQSPQQKPSAPPPPPPADNRNRDGFDAPGALAKGVLQGMEQGLRESLRAEIGGALKSLPGAKSAFERVAPYLGSKELGALDQQLKSEWFKKLSPGDQEKTFKSLLNEVTPHNVKTMLQLERFR